MWLMASAHAVDDEEIEKNNEPTDDKIADR